MCLAATHSTAFVHVSHTIHVIKLCNVLFFFYVLLTVPLSLILAISQLNAQILLLY